MNSKPWYFTDQGRVPVLEKHKKNDSSSFEDFFFKNIRDGSLSLIVSIQRYSLKYFAILNKKLIDYYLLRNEIIAFKKSPQT